MLIGRGVQAVQRLELNSLRCTLRAHRQPYRRALQNYASSNSCRMVHSSSSTTSSASEQGSRYWMASCLVAAGVTTLIIFNNKALHLDDAQLGDKVASSFRLDPSTSQPFPLVLPAPQTSLPSTCKEMILVGLGVRTVSFLRVKVYVAGLYIDSQALQGLSKIEGWKGFEKAWMMDNKDEHSGEKLLAALIDQGVAFTIRIVPVRSTDYGHLRDGFTRAIQGRAKMARKQQQLDEQSDEALSLSLQTLKDAFPRTSLPKGKALDLIFTPSPSGEGLDLELEEEGKVLGRIPSPRGLAESRFSVARQLLLAYFADKDEISKPFKESVAQGLEDAMHH